MGVRQFRVLVQFAGQKCSKLARWLELGDASDLAFTPFAKNGVFFLFLRMQCAFSILCFGSIFSYPRLK